MSSNLAIAAVSAVMKYLLQNPSPGNSIASITPDLKISAVPPSQVDGDAPCLNLFFQRASVNTGWAQNELPSRNSQGERTSNPMLALDLYYLISAHGTKDFLGEVMLGYAMQTFHENAVLPRDAIRSALTSPSLVTTDTPASMLAALAASELADQFEQIKITPHYPTPEELSNLWSAMSVGYAPTACYKVSTALIESKRPARASLPVRGFNVYAFPFNQPRIEDVIAVAGAGQPILAESRIVIRGNSLKGDNTRVRVGGIERSGAQIEVSGERIEMDLPAGLKAGIVGVQVLHLFEIGTPPLPHKGLESNVSAFVLQPRIKRIDPNNPNSNYDIQIVAPAGSQPRKLRIGVAPDVAPDQRATLSLNEMNAPNTREAFAFTFEADKRAPNSVPIGQLEFAIPNVPNGKYLVRLRVDGAESPLDFTEAGGYVSPAVTLA